jgi:hypothetical protein
MKKIVLALAVVASLAGSVQAEAHGYYGGYGYRGGYYGGNGWGVAGAVLGGMVVGAAINQATQPVYVQQQPVYVQQQPQVIYQQEYRTPPQYTPQYLPPVSCVPAYDQFGRYLGCMR